MKSGERMVASVTVCSSIGHGVIREAMLLPGCECVTKYALFTPGRTIRALSTRLVAPYPIRVPDIA
eukprot:1173189-Rhodomonas_salina.1